MGKFGRSLVLWGVMCCSEFHGEMQVCDVDAIYDRGFEYFLPKSTLVSFLDGKAFDSKVSYSEEERELLLEDIQDIYAHIVAQQLPERREAVMTAGGPGSGKTTLMKQDLACQRKSRDFAYIDPDDVCLRSMQRTYLKDLEDAFSAIHRQTFFSEEEETLTEMNTRQVLYNHWRPGSNAANHLILANLIREGRPFYFGTTSTSSTAVNLLALLKKEGYDIRLLHITASDDVRWASILKQNQKFLHTTAEDVFEKGKLFPQRLYDTYFKWADTIEFYYKPEPDQNAILTAVWTRKSGIRVINQSGYESIQKIHNEYCLRLGRQDLLWNIPPQG